LAAGAGLGLEPVDEVDDVEEAAPRPVLDAGAVVMISSKAAFMP